MPTRLKPHPSDQHEFDIYASANRFRVIRFLGRGRYDRREFKALAAAIEDARYDPHAMVYAVRDDNRFAMVPRHRWAALL